MIATRYLVAIVSGAVGVIFTLITQRLLKKRGLLSYLVRHDRLGMSADDAVFGSVRVTWNDNPVQSLYASTVELTNESLNDYEDVVVRVYSSDTILLNERTEIVGTPRIVEWEPTFAQQLHVPHGTAPTPEQLDTYNRSRVYLIPVLNRGQVVRLSYLNTARGDATPSIWLDVLHKGVKLRYRSRPNEIMGVPAFLASAVGGLIGILLVIVISLEVRSVLLAAWIALLYGFIAQLPGVLVIRAWRRVRDWIAD